MTQHTGTQRTYTKPLMMTGGGILALALLTGCSVADPGSSDSETSTAATAESSPATAETSPSSSDEAGTPPASGSSASSNAEGTATGEDPVFAAIDALLAEHADAVIVQIDLDDDDSVYEIEAVIGDRVVDFDVRADGSVREDDDDRDDDDIRRAQEATVTAEDAARAALEGRDGQSIDDMELDEDNGTLRWEIDLDRQGGDDGDELYVDAATGEVTQDN
ncbi:PepSY domain-containing protein [Microbacterium sp. A93]|uniref:PepSY domain-containing protein n=1 Tax=Microbacterium sp. A93 TaxID=3450716 RepID=UPI003F443DD5